MIKRFFSYFKICFRNSYSKAKIDAIKVLKKIKTTKKNIIIEEKRKELIKNKDTIFVKDYGAGSKKTSSRTISKIAGISVSSKKKCELIQKIIESFDIQSVIEFGTSLGISTMYIKNSATNPKVITIEGDKKLSQIAQRNFADLKFDIEIINSTFDSYIRNYDYINKVDMLYIDGNHKKDATIRYFNFGKKIINKNGIILFDDIRWSNGMLDAWKEIILKEKKGTFVDFGTMGLYLFSKKEKQIICLPKFL